MKFKAAALCVMFGLGTVGAPCAARECWFGLTVGASVPASDMLTASEDDLAFNEVASSGWDLGGTATFRMSRILGLGLDAGYHSWPGSDFLNSNISQNSFAPGGGPVVAEGHWSALQATGHGQVYIPTSGRVRPYFQIGAGMYMVTLSYATDVAGDGSSKKARLGYNGGIGANVIANDKMAVGLSGLYHYIPRKDEFYGNYTAFTVQVSLLWKSAGE